MEPIIGITGMAADVEPAALHWATELYLDLHHHPELSGAEERTAARFAARLDSLGYRVTRGIGGHGVVAVLRNGPGPVVMLRAELDALPVEERTGLPYASDTPGVMHACGHDAHLACAAGAAAELAAARTDWRGTVLVVGQPAEETLTGAAAMLADGLYRRFEPPSAVLAQHTVPLPAGLVAHGYGPVTAGSRTLRLTLHGRGGHAATPHLAIDPVPAAAAVVLRLPGLVAQETSPAEQVVATVGALTAGSDPGNVIPDRATLTVTVRGYSEAALDRVTAAVQRVARGEALASGCPREPEIEELARSGVNHPDPALTATVRAAHRTAFGPHRVTDWPPSPATEDFPLFGPAGLTLHGIPDIRTAYWMLGSVGPRTWAAAPGHTPAEKLPALPTNHSPHYHPHAKLTLTTGIHALATAARAVLTSN
ncbi:amidohydrolase [Kitasatospora sp. LaBMicrA B282]|uniref:amidohydrolase n=1 Tax=Kitasatospora sp. LaBMicrA B282 TaxID=3420949 RepID=UPI003D0F6B39